MRGSRRAGPDGWDAVYTLSGELYLTSGVPMGAGARLSAGPRSRSVQRSPFGRRLGDSNPDFYSKDRSSAACRTLGIRGLAPCGDLLQLMRSSVSGSAVRSTPDAGT
jgi:hypothetical protein